MPSLHKRSSRSKSKSKTDSKKKWLQKVSANKQKILSSKNPHKKLLTLVRSRK